MTRSAGFQPAGEAASSRRPDETPLPDVSDRGVDLWQIRRLVKLSPEERFRLGIANSRAAFQLLGAAQ